jgi:antitoxin YefM
MEVLTFTYTRQNLTDVMDRVVRDHTPVVITRRKAESVVMALSDWHSLEETARLLSSPKNATRLTESIVDLEAGCGEEDDPVEL